MDQDIPTDPHAEIRIEVAKLCARFPGEYWRKLDRDRAYPTEFVQALTEAGYLAALIPEEYGGAGLPLSAAAAILETIHAEGCNGAACHAQMYIMGTILRHGSAQQKQEYLSKIATGEARLQAFGVTEPTSGHQIPTFAAVFVAEIGDVTRFSRPEKLCCWAGLTPRHRESDTTVHRGPITKQGSKLVRWAAIEACQRTRAGTKLAADRSRIIAARGRNVGVVAAARRLLTLVFYGLRDGQIRALAARAG